MGRAAVSERAEVAGAEPRHPGFSTAQLLDPVGVPESVEGMLNCVAVGRHVRDHHRSAIRSHKGVLEDLCKFRPTKRRMVELLVERTDALLEGQQRLVDLCAVHPGLPVGVERIGATLATGQIDEGDLPVLHRAVGLLIPHILEADLQDGMGARGVDIRPGDSCRAAVEPEVNDLHKLLDVLNAMLLQPDDDHIRLRVLPRMKKLPIV
mmetsp:Transcript_51021/g.109288  ORF Transcript_51021/g.109288 Transcript_51021/m.109288 type:complete len:208 (-) Transcript_51021:405-1028(-)